MTSHGLTLTLKEGERILVENLKTGARLWIRLSQLRAHTGRISIMAPQEYSIVREELLATEGEDVSTEEQ